MKLVDVLEKYCERMEKELEDQLKKIDKLNPLPLAELDISDKLLHSVKSIKTILAMLEYNDEEDNGYSGKYYSAPTYARRKYNNGGYSGNYSSNTSNGRGYSRDSEKQDMIRKLENMMSRVLSDDEAMAIQDALEIVNRMN